MEVWRPCVGYDKYDVSPEGLVKNHESGVVLKTRQNQRGAVMVNLAGKDTRDTRSVALLVANVYLAPPRSEAYNAVIHLDGDRTNCHANNLMWRPRWYAIRYHRQFSTPPKNVSVEIVETGELFGTLREACVKYGLDEQYTYADMLRGEKCFHYGYHFRIA